MSLPKWAPAVLRWAPALLILAIFLAGYLGQGQGAPAAPAPAVVKPAVAAPSGPPPGATFDVESVDLGEVPIGQLVTQTFRVGNAGPGPLVIEGTWAKALEGC